MRRDFIEKFNKITNMIIQNHSRGYYYPIIRIYGKNIINILNEVKRIDP